MAYKKFNLYEGVKISEKILSVAIVLGLVALAVIIIVLAKPDENKKIDTKIIMTTENKAHIPINQENTLNMIK